jgi:hypothetical protein
MSIENNKKTEEILCSLDGVKRAAPASFFYTRLKARMEKELLPSGTKTRGLKPAYAFTLLLVILLANAAVIFTNVNSSVETASAGSERETLQTIAAEYNPNDVSSLYDLNEDR